MKPKALLRIIVPLLPLPIILACSLAGASTLPRSPTLAVASGAQGGIPFFASPLRLVIPNQLAVSASAETIDVVTDQTGMPWDVAPAHLQITLHSYALGSSFQVPQIFVYPAPDYAAANALAAESIRRLQAVISDPAAPYRDDNLPRIPFINAGQVFAAQEKILPFRGGSGLRIVTQYASDVSPVNNGGLFYHFEGLTSDGRYYVVAILPVNLPFLSADNNPDSPVPSGGIAFPANNASGSDFEAYFKQITAQINSAAPNQFSPALNTLDALIQSFSIQ
ncbi:MAG TPA: hypothetical protein VLZ89_05435 [Anaerolineales bacterium]|nr:hypothetical protein [Anaerolineales bacterium]